MPNASIKDAEKQVGPSPYTEHGNRPSAAPYTQPSRSCNTRSDVVMSMRLTPESTDSPLPSRVSG